jgi:MFS family permease
VHGSYVSDLLPGYLMVGFGLALAFIPVSIAALAGVGPRDAGLASGLINTSQQVGGAIGVAIASSVAVSRITHLLHHGSSNAVALTSGYSLAFSVVAAISAAGVVTALVFIRSGTLTELEAEADLEAAEAMA